MAIIDHFEVTILVDGNPATEFNEEESPNQPKNPKATTKYIEVKSGSRFAFKFRVLPSYRPHNEDGLSFHFHIDGNCVSGTICQKEKVHPVNGFTCIQDSKFVVSGTEGNQLMFSFADLETRDTCAADLATLKEKYGELGCLEVKVVRIRIRGDFAQISQNPQQRNEDVPEKALKGRAIAVAAKMETAPLNGRSRPRVLDVEEIENHPLARFKFLYRTRAALQTEMIIPRSPSPVSLEETAVEDLTPEEMREIIRRQREQAVKIEDEVPKIKRERPLSSMVPLRPLKTTKTSEGKTVYHLESDDEEGSDSSSVEEEREPVEIIEL